MTRIRARPGRGATTGFVAEATRQQGMERTNSSMAGSGNADELAATSAAPEPFVHALLAAMSALRDGNFAVRMQSDLTGVNGKIADAFNDIALVSERQAALEQANKELQFRMAERTAALSEARDEAERQSRLKDEFLATLSHELRTPMNAILGWLRVLEQGAAAADPGHAMDVIRRNARAQSKLIEDLLEMNRFMSGNARLELGPVDLRSVLDATIQSLKPAADAKGVRLSAVSDPAMPIITGDARRIQQVLWNLLHNGVKFTGAGGRVDVSLRRWGRSACIAVEDTGQGIAADFLPFVFDRFRQADATTTRDAWGLGLGLSISKHLVELHGGSISAVSPGPQRGSTFVVQLPLEDPPSSSV